jgi:uncharacterized membrane protein
MSESTVGKSSLGMDENLAAVLSYILGIITGILFFVMEKDSKFVKFHAMQSILFWVVMFVLSIVSGFVPVIGWIFGVTILPLASIVLWILLMYKAYQNEMFKLPVIGDIAEQQVAKLSNN